MGVHYSPSMRGFYFDEFPPEPPDDSVALTEEEYRELLAGQSTGGMQIEPDETGFPVLVPQGVSPPTAPASFTPEQVADMRKKLGI